MSKIRDGKTFLLLSALTLSPGIGAADTPPGSGSPFRDPQAAEQRFREIQARGGTGIEQKFRAYTESRKVVNQPTAGGSALDLTKRNVTGATSIGGGGGRLTEANAAQVLDGAKAQLSARTWLYVKNGQVWIESPYSDWGMSRRPVSGCLRSDTSCVINFSRGTLGRKYRLTAEGVYVSRRELNPCRTLPCSTAAAQYVWSEYSFLGPWKQ